MESILSIIATIVSSVALIGVALGLILQNNQLRANRIQVMREMHLELMKIGMENPELTASIYGDTTVKDFPKSSYLNFIMTFWETGYSLQALSGKSIEFQAARLFASEYARTSWANEMGAAYRADAGTKYEIEFCEIIDRALKNVMLAQHWTTPLNLNSSNGEENNNPPSSAQDSRALPLPAPQAYQAPSGAYAASME